MSTKHLSIGDDRILAHYVDQKEFKGFFEKRIGVPPDHMALLIRNGQFVNAYIGGHFSFGGFVNQLRGVFGGSQHIAMILADLRTFQLKLPVRGLTKDHVEVVGVASIDVQINPERPQDIVGLMSALPYLLKDEILNRLKPHISDRIVEATIGRLEAMELRGNEGLQNKLQADILKTVERVAGDLGLLVRAVSLEWAVNEVEREAMDAAAADRAVDAMDHKFELIKREIARQKEGFTLQVQTNLDMKKLEGASEAELARMVLDNEIAFIDARESAQHAQELKALHREIEKLEIERKVQLENALADAEHVIGLTERKARLQKLEHGMKRADADLNRDIMVADAAAQQQILDAKNVSSVAHIKALNDIEQSTADAEAKRGEAGLVTKSNIKINEGNAAAANRAGELSIFAGMSTEQILAAQAGTSQGAAGVLAEQARAAASANAKAEALMQQMVEQNQAARIQSEEQARAMFDSGMKGVVGVAAGAGGKAAPAAEAAEANPGKTKIECPKCHQENELRMRHCTNCGAQLRT